MSRDFRGDQKALRVPTWLLIVTIPLVELHARSSRQHCSALRGRIYVVTCESVDNSSV